MTFLETIKIENGEFANLELHQKRMNITQLKFFKNYNGIDLSSELNSFLKTLNKQIEINDNNTYKCRITYSNKIQHIEILPYSITKIESLKIIECNEISYDFKFEDRDIINQLFSRKDQADDILIVKNGLITDTSYCNIVFFNGSKWLSPERPLLKGVQRQYLLNKEIIETAKIRTADLHHFQKARLINALIPFDYALDINMQNIS